jgi:hypothetical protein
LAIWSSCDCWLAAMAAANNAATEIRPIASTTVAINTSTSVNPRDL